VYPVRIVGERVVLRDVEPDDLDASLAVVGDPRVTRTLSFDPRSRKEQAARLAEDVERARTTPRSEYYLAITVGGSDRLSGFVRLGLGPHRSGELGYALRADCWHRGYASEAARLMLDFAFATLKLHRVHAACGPDNTASQAVLDRLGFTYEGRIRDHVLTGGAWRDSLLYGLLEQEWPPEGGDERPSLT
jgi:ribosomal-protein-alanine N-acetyltransferase